MLVVMLVLFSGLRIEFNDTANYLRGFRQASGLKEFLLNPKNLNIFKNPLFYAFQCLLRDFTDNAQMLVFLTSLFNQVCFIYFLKRYSRNFTFSIFLYIATGTFSLTLAAMKQVTAMAVLTLAVPLLERRKWIRYYCVVFIAMLIHTYAIAFAVLPLFGRRPWKLFTYLFTVAVIVLMMNFQDVISELLDQADELGKSIAAYEVFDDNTINIFRIAVYAVAPLISFVFQHWIFKESSTAQNVLVHMSIISLAFMVMGTQSGANMFGRMANYFELGTVCVLPWMLQQTFNKRSYRLVSAIAIVCYLGFFIYANGIHGSFDRGYNATSILRLFLS